MPAHVLRGPFNDGRFLRGRDLSYGVIFNRAGHHTFSAFHTERLVHTFLSVLGSKDRLDGAAPQAGIAAAGAFLEVYILGRQGTARPGRTAFCLNVGDIFIPKIPERRNYGVGSCPA